MACERIKKLSESCTSERDRSSIQIRLTLKFALAISAVLSIAVAAMAQETVLKGKVSKDLEVKPGAALIDKYGDAANDPAAASALRKAQGKQSTDDKKAKSDNYEALQSGVWKPGADPTTAIMNGYIPPNMSPEQAAILAKHLPKIPRMPRPMSPEEMAGEPNPDLQMAGMPAPMSPYIPIPDSVAAASRQPNTRQLSLIPQFPMSPEQLVGGPGMAPMMMGASVMPYGAGKQAIAEANQRHLEDYLRDRLGPGYKLPVQGNHNPRAPERKSAEGNHIIESDHQSTVGLCDANGNEITSIQYDPWGNHTVLSGGTVMPTFMYKGMLWHDRSQKYLTLHRVYDPKLARWLSRDPLGEPAGNLYAYCLNNPINYSDPLGLCPGDWFSSRQAAAKDAIKGYNPQSMARNREVIGRLYRDPGSGKYYATPGVLAGLAGGNLPPIPAGMVTAGDWHTHGNYSDLAGNVVPQALDAFDSNHFSPQDINTHAAQNAANPGYQGYLGTPEAHWWVDNPTTATQTDLGPLPPPPADLSKWPL